MRFDEKRFFEAVESRRSLEGKSWRQLAAQLSLSPSTFSRLSQGKRPDVDTFVKLLAWMQRQAEEFVDDPGSKKADISTPGDTVRNVADSLRNEPSLTPESADALEEIVRVAYHRFRSS